MERSGHAHAGTETAPAQDAAAPVQDNAQTRFISKGDVPGVDMSQREQGPSASDRAFEAHKGNHTLKPRHDMTWSDDISHNAVKDAFWKARWNGEVDHIGAAQQEIIRRAEAAPDEAGLKGNGHFWATELGNLLWSVKKLHDNAKGGARSYVDVHAFRQVLASFPTKQLLWPDEKALILDGFETLVNEGAAKWNKPVGLAERTGGGEGAQETAPEPTTETKPENKEQKKENKEGGERFAQIVKVLGWAAKIPGLKPHLELIHSTLELVEKAEKGEATPAEYAQNISELGQALMEELAVIMKAVADGSEEATQLVEHLEGVAAVFGMPAAVIHGADDIVVLIRGHHLSGKPATEKERYLSGFDAVKQLASFAKGAAVLAEMSPRLSTALMPIGEALGWANPISIGATVSYYELEFCLNHVYAPAKKYLGQYLTNKRTGGDPEDIIKRIEAMSVSKETFVDIAPFFSGSTGESLAYLYGNASVFGQGERGWGWLGEGEHAEVGTWTRFWDDSIRGGKLAQFAMPDIAKDHEKYWGNLAMIAKELAVQFVRQQIASGRVATR